MFECSCKISKHPRRPASAPHAESPVRTTVELRCAARGVADEGSPARRHPDARRSELRPDGDLHGRAPRRGGARADPQPAEQRVAQRPARRLGQRPVGAGPGVLGRSGRARRVDRARARRVGEIRPGRRTTPTSSYLAPLAGDIASADLAADPALVVGSITELRVFRGYSGWGSGQLEAEIESGSWLVLDSGPGRRVHGRTRRTLARRAAPPARSPRLAGLAPDDLAWN